MASAVSPIAPSSRGHLAVGLPRLSMHSVLAAEAAIFLALKPIGVGPLVLLGGIITLPAIVTC